MTDLLTPVRAWVVDTLDPVMAAIGWQAFDDVPQGTKPNFVKLGLMQAKLLGDDDDKDDDLRIVTVVLVYVYQGQDRGEMLAAMAAGEAALAASVPEAAGAAFNPPRFVQWTSSDVSPEDGVTYAGLTTFQMIAQIL